MMFRALAPSLSLWAANPRALRIVLLDKNGQPQDLTGRTATLAVRRSSMLEPRVTVESVMSTDGYAWLFLLTADQCDLLYADGQAYSLSYDVIETGAGGSLRWTGRIDVQPASELPGGGASPVLVDLPVAELVSETDTILISERGATGFGVEQRLKDLGDIPEADPALMRDKIRDWGAEGGAPFAVTAELARDAALEQADRSQVEADRSEEQKSLAVDQADRATLAADRAQLADESVQGGANAYDDIVTGRSSVAIGELFRVFQPNGSVKTYRKTGTSSQEEKSEIESRAAAEEARGIGDGTAESRATDTDALRAIATRNLIGRQSATAEGRAGDTDALRAIATRDLIARQSATAEGRAGDTDAVRTIATRDLIRRQSATAEGRAGDTDVLRTIATRDLIRRQSLSAEGSASDTDFLRTIATRDLIRRQAATAEGRAFDSEILRQPITRLPPTSARVGLIDIVHRVADRSVVITPGRSAMSSAGRAIYFGGSLDIPAPDSGHIEGEAITINSYNATVSFVYASGGRLSRADVSNVVVRDAATSEVLTLNTHYRLSAATGAIMKVAPGDANRAVTVDYDWSDIRYDLIEVDAVGALSLKLGTSRPRDVAEFLPGRTAGRTPVLNVRSDKAGVTAWRWTDPEDALLSAPTIIQRGRARRMPNLRKALRTGSPIVLAGYGDSRTSLGGTDSYAPNHPMQDRVTEGYMLAQGADYKATIPLYDFGDGEGQVHTKIGWNWDLLRAIEALYPNEVSYLNFGWGGTTSGATANGGTVPARLAALTGSGATIANVAFGMNELGTGDTAANLVAIGEACRTASIDPVFIAPARPNIERSSGSLDVWIIENREVQAAADYLQAPFIDTVALYGADRLTGRLAMREMCSSNHFNHDSIYELGLIGRALSAIVLDI